MDAVIKRHVYLSQPNHSYGRNCFLPYSAGMIQAYAQKFPEINESYDFQPIIFRREEIAGIIARMQDKPPDVLGLSCYIWNFEYNMALARAVKERFPLCLVVAGGPHIPIRSEDFAQPAVDVAVHYEGEKAFSGILLDRLAGKPAPAAATAGRIENLDDLPSPYLSGIFDSLIADNPALEFHATQETHRGCPYSCFGADTLIALPDKMVRFGDEAYGDPVRCAEGHGHRPCTSDKRLVYQGRKPCLVFGMSNGLKLVVTRDHPMIIVDHEKMVERPAQEVKAGDWIPIEVGQNSIKRYQTLSEPSVLEAEFLAAFGLGQGRRCPKPITIPKFFDEEIAWLTGFLIGDGCIAEDGRASISFAVTDGIRTKLRKAIARFGVVLAENDSSQTKKMTNGQVHSRKFQQFFTECLGMKSGEGKLTVPKIVLRSPASAVRAFLRGLWDADGYKPPQGPPYLVTASERLSREAAALIQWIGDATVVRKIKACRSETTYAGAADYHYRVEWHAQACFSRSKGHPCLASSVPIARKPYRSRHDGHLAYRKTFGGSAYRISRKVLGQLEPEHPMLSRSFVYVQVSSVKSAPAQDVYDVHHHPTHKVGANGIYVRQCTFCDWGSAVFTKLRKFEDNRIFLELGWMVEHKIELLYNADANYGIFPRDLGITKVMAGAKREHGYPKKFRAAFAKNSNDKIFEHARILHEAGMNKGVTLSFQSMDEKVLETVKRDNIKITDFKRLMGKYQAAGIATYSEVILGLPGETYDSFAQGLNTLLDCGQHDSLQIYTCEVLPNSEMNAPAYKKEHEIRSVRSPIPMFHGTPAVDPCQEYYDLVVSTKTMPTEHWLHAQMLAWIVQAFHCLGLTQQIAIAMNRLHDLSYRRFYEAILDQVDRADQGSVIATVIQAAARSFEDLLSGKDWGAYNPSFGNVTWPPEEASFLQIVSIRKQFYEELFPIVKRLCPGAADILEDLFLYQAELVATPDGEPRQVRLAHDWPEFFRGGTYKDVPCTLKIEPEGLYQGNLENFAREVIWYGRKGGTFKNKVSYADR